MWIKRLTSQVQRGACGIQGPAINRTAPCDIARRPNWENPARITPGVLIQTPLNFINGLLSFKNSETIEASAPNPLTKGKRLPRCGPAVDGVAAL